MRHPSPHWDIFCAVVDNYGDIGVTWRLSRQLATEYGLPIRLWVDDLRAFHHINPEVDCNAAVQLLNRVEIRHWVPPLPDIVPGEVVIEALACNIPEPYIQAMATITPKPIWINLEYLSAESWVAGVHGLPSPHPRLPLTKYFFMPGYIPQTGGLLRERGLNTIRTTFQNDTPTQTRFWRGLGIPDNSAGRLRVSLFSYESSALAGLLTACSRSNQGIDLMVPMGKAIAHIAEWFGRTDIHAGNQLERGQLRVYILPMLPLDDYDRLLWACDCNFVRGEDSFVRAQFAGRPLIWQAYRQEEGAHLAKLDAFLDIYCANLPTATASLVRAVWRAWNQENDMTMHWPTWLAALPALNAHAGDWAKKLSEQHDLTANLVKFINKLL